ncbi:MAG: protein DpdE [Bryobacteraceae bacterium]
MQTRPLSIFVESRTEPLGIGKLVDWHGEAGEVEFFDSPFGPKIHRRSFRRAELRATKLGLQTRVFWLDKSSGVWRAGRVDGSPITPELPRTSEECYPVRFPNHNDRNIPVSDLYVRWSKPITDPAEFLASQVSDTPFFADGRAAIVQHFLEQRRGYKGLTALASSSIELIPHQVTIIRRVLGDPVQRYVLADEVGLGKTIEAGVLIRQHLIDNPWDHQVVIVAPDHLVEQWRLELANKFFVHEAERVHIISESDVPGRSLPERVSLLVVDEAHRTATSAFCESDPSHALYAAIASLARRSRSILLLSGTPVLHQETGFLAMLHLLDPTAYPLGDVDGFQKRVSERQTVAEALMDLSDDSSVLFAEEALTRLEGSFSSDDRLLQLCARVRQSFEEEVTSAGRMESLRALREHLSETYKLHRRVLRTRRADPRISDFLPKRTGVTTIAGEDEARNEAADFLEAWRLAVPDLLCGEGGVSTQFVEFVEASLSHPRLLAARVQERIQTLEETCPSEELFPGESAFLKMRLRLILDASAADVRVGRLADWIAANREFRKGLLFVTDSEVADSFATELEHHIGPAAVIRYRGAVNELQAFESASHPVLLVCDCRAEEGLNLQQAGAVVIHGDLPLEPARLEQRIGRVDRIEARGQLRNVIFAADHGYEKQWQECLVRGIRIFDRSVAPLQYALAETVTRIKANLLRDGVDAIEGEALTLPSVLGRELERIQAQEALDAIDTANDSDAKFFAGIVAADEHISDVGEKALNAWVKDRLRFASRDEGDGVKRYVYDLRKPTLMPLSNAVSDFLSCIDEKATRVNSRFELPLKPFAVDRSKAEKHQLPLLRVGHPFLEALEASVGNDDRGRCFAMWRYLPSNRQPALYFRLDFLIEADLRRAKQLVEEFGMTPAALNRRADEAFPPIYARIWLTADLEPIGNRALINTLSLPYSRDARIAGGFDRNVRGERWEETLTSVAITDWAELVLRAKNAGTAAMRSDRKLLAHSVQRAECFQKASAMAGSRLQARISRLVGHQRTAEQVMADREAAINDLVRDGVAHPNITLDCIGAMILSGTPLQAE